MPSIYSDVNPGFWECLGGNVATDIEESCYVNTGCPACTDVKYYERFQDFGKRGAQRSDLIHRPTPF